MVGEEPLQKRCIARVADNQLASCYRRLKPGAQVVQCNNRLSGSAELPNDVAADVSRAASD